MLSISYIVVAVVDIADADQTHVLRLDLRREPTELHERLRTEAEQGREGHTVDVP